MNKHKKLTKVLLLTLLAIVLLAFSATAYAAPVASKTVTAEDILKKVDVGYTIHLTDRVANLWPTGFAIAGSRADAVQADFLVKEMKRVGLKNVTKDAFPVDGWDYNKLTLKVNTPEIRNIPIAPYAGSVGTNGKDLTAEIVYAGYGTKAELEKADVKGKIVLAEFDLLYDYWPSMVAHEAEKMGAKALIIFYSDTNITDPDALNSFDTQSRLAIPIANISKNNGAYFQQLLGKGKVTVTFNSDAKVTKNQKSHNIIGYIPGKNPDKYIIIGGHRDTFFKPFSDDILGCTTAISIAKAMNAAKYQPEHTLIFINYGAEEYGVAERRYDWAVGSWYLFNKNHPEWKEKTSICFNIDNYLSNHLSTTYRMRSANALMGYMEEYVDKNGVPEKWTDGVSFLHPSSTFNDTYVATVLGVPGIDMNKTAFDPGQYSNYHTPLDTKQHYFGTEEDAAASRESIRYTLENYIRMIVEFDQMAMSPLDFSADMQLFAASVDAAELNSFGIDSTAVVEKSAAFGAQSKAYTEKIKQINAAVAKNPQKAKAVQAAINAENKKTYDVFQNFQNTFYKLDVWDGVIFAHEKPQGNLIYLQKTLDALQAGDAKAAVKALGGTDLSYYAGWFSEDVFDRWYFDALDQSKYNIYWAKDRLIRHLDTYGLYNKLNAAAVTTGKKDFSAEIKEVEKLIAEQTALTQSFFSSQSTSMDKAMQQLNPANLDKILTQLK